MKTKFMYSAFVRMLVCFTIIGTHIVVSVAMFAEHLVSVRYNM